MKVDHNIKLLWKKCEYKQIQVTRVCCTALPTIWWSHKWHQVHFLCQSHKSSLPLSETLFETGLSRPARFSSKGNKSVFKKLKGLVLINVPLHSIFALESISISCLIKIIHFWSLWCDHWTFDGINKNLLEFKTQGQIKISLSRDLQGPPGTTRDHKRSPATRDCQWFLQICWSPKFHFFGHIQAKKHQFLQTNSDFSVFSELLAFFWILPLFSDYARDQNHRQPFMTTQGHPGIWAWQKWTMISHW